MKKVSHLPSTAASACAAPVARKTGNPRARKGALAQRAAIVSFKLAAPVNRAVGAVKRPAQKLNGAILARAIWRPIHAGYAMPVGGAIKRPVEPERPASSAKRGSIKTERISADLAAATDKSVALFRNVGASASLDLGILMASAKAAAKLGNVRALRLSKAANARPGAQSAMASANPAALLELAPVVSLTKARPARTFTATASASVKRRRSRAHGPKRSNGLKHLGPTFWLML